MTDQDKLLPCPFCDNEPFYQNSLKYHSIDCLNEFCTVRPCTDTFNHKDEAVKSWNTRANLCPPDAAARIAELEKCLRDVIRIADRKTVEFDRARAALGEDK